MLRLERAENFVTRNKFALFSFFDCVGESNIFKRFFQQIAHEVLPLLQNLHNSGLQSFFQFGFINQSA